MEPPFSFTRHARQLSSLLGVALGFIGLILLIFVVHAHPAFIAVLAVLLSPAIWDLVVNARAEMQVNDTTLSWRVGRRAGEVALSDIERVKAVTTLDLSQRATVFTRSGKKLYIPSPCMPPSRTFDAQMINRKVPFHRALF